MRERASIARSLDQAAERLARGGVLDAKREATALWAAVEGVKPGAVWLKRESAPPSPVEGHFWKAVARRASGIPFAYAVGRVGFRTLELQIDRRALIPRPETEGLVDLVLNWARRGTGGVVADIGTGCGCIALALAVEGTFERVIAVERSPEGAALARENVARIRPATPVEVREGELLEPLVRMGGGERFRVIVSNPPYLTDAEFEALEPSVRLFEPRAALVSGADGLEATRALFARAAALLEPEGLLAIEIDARCGDEVRALGHEWRRVDIHADLFGRPRYALAFPGEDA